jgi:hypothetical protein
LYRKDFDDELIVKKEIAIKDFYLLSSSGILGAYLECELTHIFIVEKETDHVYHYYAVCSYEEFIESNNDQRNVHLTKKLIKINDNYSLGIMQIRLSLEESKDVFNQLCKKQFHFQNQNIVLPDTLQLLPKTHIPSFFDDDVSINNILKPNFWGDKYIIEFVSTKTPFDGLFSASDFDKVNEVISNHLPINLSLVNDRIGSFIFQFPITLISVDSGISHDWCKASLSMRVHSQLSHNNNICTIVKTKLDDTITGFNSFNGVFDNIELELGDSNNLELLVFNTSNAIIYKNSLVNFLRDVYIGGGLSMQNAEPRVITHENGSTTEITLVNYNLGIKTGGGNYYDSRTNERVINNDIINHSGDFQNFYPGEEKKAFEYIRIRLDRYAGSSIEIWLWDPFLRSQDIMEILYYVDIINMPMKCITSYRDIKSYNKEYKGYLSFKESEKDKFLSQKNLGINLEFRAVHDNIGFNFHDRFLFFIPNEPDKIPIVYSLGTSINSLGKKHHLIMQTVYPRNIVKAFKELWQELASDKESLIIKLPEGR